MKLSEYYRTMADIDGHPMPPDDPRVTRRDMKFDDGPGKQGSCTITFLDGQPVYLNWYIWNLDRDWLFEQVEKELGHKIRLSNFTGGNGHEGANLERLYPAHVDVETIDILIKRNRETLARLEELRLETIARLASKQLEFEIEPHGLRHSEVPCPESPSGFCAHDLFDRTNFPGYGPCLFCQGPWKRPEAK